MRKRKWLFVSACLFVAFAAAGRDAVPAARPAPDARITRDDVDGVSLAHWTERWWQWAYALPIEPYRDPDGRFCDLGQEGPVWFLAGTDGSFDATRRCILPADAHVLVPIINMAHLSTRSRPRGCEQLQRAAAVNNNHLISAVAILDGKPLGSVALHRVRSESCFRIAMNEHDSLLAAADGYWLMLKPLPRGRHTLVIGANYGAPDSAHGMMRQNFEYQLDVGGENRFSLSPRRLADDHARLAARE